MQTKEVEPMTENNASDFGSAV
ncbi:MAG: hypothetical protein RL743_734, partial [Actinomycetota bacterium]